MKRLSPWFLGGLLLFSSLFPLPASTDASANTIPGPFPRSLASYGDDSIPSTLQKLKHRIASEPLNLAASLIFLGAILHTFLASTFLRIAHKIKHHHQEELRRNATQTGTDSSRDPVSFAATVFHFLGEVEAIFGLWLIPLFGAIVYFYDWNHVVYYIDHAHFAEPVFVVVIMAVAATRPIIRLASSAASLAAGFGGRTVAAWWFAICTLLPILGSLITEPAAMTIAATLLGIKFYELRPSPRLMYATLGCLFVAISVGGTLTHFAAPPVLMVAGTWHLNTPAMFTHYGWKAVCAIISFNLLTLAVFRTEFRALQDRAVKLAAGRSGEVEYPVPFWITGVHLFFLAWTVLTLHHPPFVIGGFLFFIAFSTATAHHQLQILLRGPVLVGFFLAGLILHGGLQGWWISPLLGGLGEFALFATATVLTAFNDNAAITYLASLVPALNADVAIDKNYALALEYAVLTGAVTGGGLTVIANAPNPAGQSILSKYFPDGISPLGLLLGALGPTVIVALFFVLLKSI